MLLNSTESRYLRISSCDAFSWFWDRQGEAFSNSELRAYLFRMFEKREEKKESCGVTSAGITYALTPSGYSQGLSPFKEESLSTFGCIPRKCGVCKAGV